MRQSSIQQARDREALMKSIKGPRTVQPSSDVQMLVSERERIDHSHGIADAVLDTAYATRSEFGRQRQTLSRINQRLMQSASNLLAFGWTNSKVKFRGLILLLGRLVRGRGEMRLFLHRL